MIMKKFLALLLALIMVFSLAACSVEKAEEPAPAEDAAPAEDSAPAAATELTLWTFPIGKWGDQATVDALMEGFDAETGIKVKVEYLDYQTGDDKVNTAIEGGVAPDIIMEGPERLVTNWGARGLMVDMSDMLDSTDLEELNADLLSSCYSADGALYEYPLVANAFCMAINKTVFEAADAMQYLNAETHTWNSVEDFFKAVDAVYNYTGKQVGAVFCAGQGGDQGTRELVKNIGGGNLTDAAHTTYLWDEEANINALKMIYDCEGIEFDPSIVGGE
ncbi:MAG: extracellular solute-binding protein, partial [Oscillospiraceae bacterium]|nr:extracellular solute-binding protein [Oscillospiraceae bacterium]